MTTIRVIDFETTGTEPPAEVCEVGTCDLDLDARLVHTPRAWLCGVKSMPPEVRAVHHITLAECEGEQPFEAGDMFREMDIQAIAAHNAEFETKFFDSPLPVICTYKAALRVWPDAPSHGNQALRYWLGFDEMPDFDPVKADPPHRAGPDAYTTAFLLRELLKHKTVPQLLEISKYPAVLKTMNFGKHKGMTFAEAPTDYLEWLRDKSEMGADVKFTARRELQRRQKARENQVKGD